MESTFEDDLYCTTCNAKIESDPCRIIIFKKENETITKHFHYFFPCWDPDYVLTKFSEYEIVHAGFSFSERPSPEVIQNMQKNLDLWL